MFNHWTLPGELSKFNRFVVSRRLYYSTKIELGNENICARSCFRKYAVLLVVINYWFVFLQLIMISREEKSLRHVAVVAKYLDNHKPKTSLKRCIRTASNFIDLNQIHLIWQMLAKFSRVESERTVSTIGDKMSWDTSPKNGLFYVLLTSKGGNIAFLPHPLRAMLCPCSSCL